jgi:hypothetical protein
VTGSDDDKKESMKDRDEKEGTEGATEALDDLQKVGGPVVVAVEA